MTDPIDPIQFGELRADMRNMKADMVKMNGDMATMIGKLDELNALANKSKGAFWAGMTIASLFGGGLSWVVAHFHFKS
jgi:hypothetical protein